MANKTIHELTPASTVDSDYEIAVYDIDGNGTKKATADQILKTSSLLYAYDDDEPTGEVDFTSQDTTLTPSSSTSVDLLSGNDSWSQRFVKISQMFKNVRYLLSKLGTTDISSIGNGTVTNAISTLNTNLNTYKVKTIQVTERTQTLTTTASLAGFAGAPWTSLGGVKVPPNIPTGCVFVGNLGIVVNGSVGIFAIFDGVNQHHNLEVNPYIYNSTNTRLPVGTTLNLHMYSLVATTN